MIDALQMLFAAEKIGCMHNNIQEKALSNRVCRIYRVKIVALVVSAIILVLDQGTKNIVLSNLEYAQPYPLFNLLTNKLNLGLNWFLTYNYGTAFSFIKSASGSMYLFLVMSSIFVTVLLFYWLLKEQDVNKATILSFGAIIGGALGNIYDRLTLGYVVDFIDVYAGTWHWPVFNVADMAISVGVIFLVWQIFLAKQN